MGGITYEKIVGVIVIYLRINGLRFCQCLCSHYLRPYRYRYRCNEQESRIDR